MPRPPAIKLVERFDYGALTYIIDNFDSYRASFRPGTDQAETLEMLRRYISGTAVINDSLERRASLQRRP